MEEIKTNAVICSDCKTINPKFFNKCQKCGKKIDINDKRVYDEVIDGKRSATKWTPFSLSIFIITFGIIFFFSLKFLGILTSKNDSNNKDNKIAEIEILSKGESKY